jgi:hypothetical protein
MLNSFKVEMKVQIEPCTVPIPINHLPYPVDKRILPDNIHMNTPLLYQSLSIMVPLEDATARLLT